MTPEQYDAALKIAFDAGWDAAMQEAADTARHLNGWGTIPAPELADHIADCILNLAGRPDAANAVERDLTNMEAGE